MTGINIHSASPLSASSSSQSLVELDKQTLSTEENQIATEPKDMEEVPLMLASDSKSSETPPEQAEQASLPSMSSTSSRTVPRLNTTTRINTNSAPLPWKIDETSSPYSPISRKSSFVPPPPRSRASRTSIGGAQHQLPTLQTLSSSANYNNYSPPTPYTYSSSPNSQTVDLTSPSGYSQNSHDSFSDRSPYENSTPFYSNSHSFSVSSPVTPTRRDGGILDNDPDIYLRGEGDADEETMWDTAAKWAKIAGKRLSQGEQQLWKMVSAVTNTEGED
ncbi:hypothetical protein LTS08_005314 [Lithohypha guttulata]|nr:hypothetical protein LTS08_005314 [Lithohypha guttulata]